MHLVQLFLPLYGNDGRRFTREPYDLVRNELTERFGGLTAYTRAPATGLWEDGETTVRDDLVIYEVLVEVFDLDWWRSYRAALEQRFRQEAFLIRAQEIQIV